MTLPLETVAPESVGSQLAAELPPVNANAISALAADAGTPAGSAPAAPAEPVKRGRGRPKGSKTRTTAAPKSVIGDDPPPPAPEPAAPATPAGPDRASVLADCYCRAFYGGADAIFSGRGEWLPQNDEEHIALRDSLAAYLRATNAQDLPPGAALSLAVLTYAAHRVQKPRTLSTLQKWGLWIRTKWSTWRTGRRISALPAA